METANRVGEVVEVGVVDLLAESYTLHQAPPLGSFVRTGHDGIDVVGVVAGSRTGGLDPSRRPVARGHGEASEDDLYRHHPELPDLLRTEFVVRIVGYRDRGRYYHCLPPCAPRLHGFIYSCTDDEIREFSERVSFLRTLLQPAAGFGAPSDELVAACIHAAETARGGDRAYRIRAAKEVATALLGDAARLGVVLARIREAAAQQWAAAVASGEAVR